MTCQSVKFWVLDLAEWVSLIKYQDSDHLVTMTPDPYYCFLFTPSLFPLSLQSGFASDGRKNLPKPGPMQLHGFSAGGRWSGCQWKRGNKPQLKGGHPLRYWLPSCGRLPMKKKNNFNLARNKSDVLGLIHYVFFLFILSFKGFIEKGLMMIIYMVVCALERYVTGTQASERSNLDCCK